MHCFYVKKFKNIPKYMFFEIVSNWLGMCWHTPAPQLALALSMWGSVSLQMYIQFFKTSVFLHVGINKQTNCIRQQYCGLRVNDYNDTFVVRMYNSICLFNSRVNHGKISHA